MSDFWFNVLFTVAIVCVVALIGVGIYAILYLLPHVAGALGG